MPSKPAQRISDELLIDHENALLENIEFDRLKKDKAILSGLISSLDKFICGINPTVEVYKTEAGAQVEIDLVLKVKKAIAQAQIDCDNL